jgi:hypothetical protein
MRRPSATQTLAALPAVMRHSIDCLLRVPCRASLQVPRAPNGTAWVDTLPTTEVRLRSSSNSSSLLA